jgi:hypothetical protein
MTRRAAKKDQRPSQTWKRPVARWKRACLACGAPPKTGGVMYIPAGLEAFLDRDPDGTVRGVLCGDCQQPPAVVLPLDQ